MPKNISPAKPFLVRRIALTGLQGYPRNMNFSAYHEALAPIISSTLRKLLCEKHMYQGLEVDLKPLLKVSEEINIENSQPTFSREHRPSAPTTVKALQEHPASGANLPWLPTSILTRREFDDNIVSFTLPSINTYCPTCKDRPPCNPADQQCNGFLDPRSPAAQWYHLTYQCQQCQTTLITFMVRREALKLRICGRDPVELIPPPKVLPRAFTKFWSDAQVAHHAGQTLAGIFLLRTFVEQFWRSMPEVQTKQAEMLAKKARASGDEMGDAYQSTLPEIFAKFPSLKTVYSDLSAAMHEARSDGSLFESSCIKIEEHFDARRVFKLFTPEPPEEAATPEASKAK
jgi:hypothetical protein